jgi:hypothetical protein
MLLTVLQKLVAHPRVTNQKEEAIRKNRRRALHCSKLLNQILNSSSG